MQNAFAAWRAAVDQIAASDDARELASVRADIARHESAIDAARAASEPPPPPGADDWLAGIPDPVVTHDSRATHSAVADLEARLATLRTRERSIVGHLSAKLRQITAPVAAALQAETVEHAKRLADLYAVAFAAYHVTDCHELIGLGGALQKTLAALERGPFGITAQRLAVPAEALEALAQVEQIGEIGAPQAPQTVAYPRSDSRFVRRYF